MTKNDGIEILKIINWRILHLLAVEKLKHNNFRSGNTVDDNRIIIWMIPSLLASWKWNTEDIMKMAAIKLYYSQNDNDVKKKLQFF